MKIHIISDLHNEIDQFIPSVGMNSVDLVILAGDIDINARGVAWARDVFSCPVIYVPGNHEFYHSQIDLMNEKMVVASSARVRVLNDSEWILDGVRFLCATAWTNYDLTGNVPLAEIDASLALRDFDEIKGIGGRKINVSDFSAMNLKSKEWLLSKISDPFPGKTIVVTHHAPSVLSLDAKRTSSHLDAAFANKWEYMMGTSVDLWIHGHTHFPVDYNLYGTRVVSNPRGYPSDPTGFDPNLVIDTDSLNTLSSDDKAKSDENDWLNYR